MARSGGLRAMAGMQTYSHPYLRPLLAFKKQDIYDYAAIIQLKWREDLSNAKNTYNRNIWRNVLLPELESLYPSLSNDVYKLQQIFRRQTNDDRRDVQHLIPSKNKDFHVPFKVLEVLNSTQWIEFLDLLDIPKSLALSILKLAVGPNGKKIFINSNTTNYQIIWKESDGLLFQTKSDKLPPPTFKKHSVTELPKTFSKSSIFIDNSKIKGRISLRKIQTGDRINPIGIKGSKLVSNILKDAKVPRSKRKNIWLLVDEEKILAVVGYSIDKRAIAKRAPCLCVEFE
jgi:tRNA(Ile)-lysidine synthase